ncbi:MAG: hypothetical protein H7A08_04495 [Oceanospirillaceae bacterium]|nr:hypothetical protein [Oceanospirillaceae bacterium]
MTVSRSKQIELLCKRIAQDHEGWEYISNRFKKKLIGHTIQIIDMGWSISSISASAEPCVGISNKKIQNIWKIVRGNNPIFSQSIRIMNPVDQRLQYRARIKDLVADNAEGYIRDVLNIGIRMLEENWDFSSEENFLRNLPADDPTLSDGKNGLLEDDSGTRYCIARMLLGDFEYIQDFYNDEVKTKRPKRKSDLEKLMQHVADMKSAYDKQGILFSIK